MGSGIRKMMTGQVVKDLAVLRKDLGSCLEM